MNRTPPQLLYLSIYNPTLRPTGPIEGDQDDAEEQAQIVFYTSKERAVSRDRMLRQIGLAKALVSFAELFNADQPCENVHSQSRRMVMVSPEPDFWIHAGIDLAKTPRADTSKSKPKSKGKAAETTSKDGPAPPAYDYDDNSVYDGAVRARILHGYERFKLTHGSFASILSKLGQTALELQLERFWTIWSWNWDMEEAPRFGEHFGTSLHPYHSQLVPLVDGFADKLSLDLSPVILLPPSIIPSSRYTEGSYSPLLPSHLLSLIPPPVLHNSRSSDTLNTLASSVDTIRAKPIKDDAASLFGLPTMKTLDKVKWNWPGYLTFGKGSGSKPPLPTSEKAKSATDEEKNKGAAASQDTPLEPDRRVEVEVNPEALEDALSSDSLSLANAVNNNQPQPPLQPLDTQHQDVQTAVVAESGSMLATPRPNDVVPVSVASQLPSAEEESPLPSPPPFPEFSLTRIYLSPKDDPQATTQVTVHYYVRDQYMLALLPRPGSGSEGIETEATDLEIAGNQVSALFDEIEALIREEDLKQKSDALPTLSKILQPQDRYMVATEQFSLSSPNFMSHSSHLFNAKAILDLDPDVREVFSRGQNPQHWHVAKRGLNSKTDANVEDKEGVYLQVFRKETSLPEVDNILANVVKKSGLSSSGQSS